MPQIFGPVSKPSDDSIGTSKTPCQPLFLPPPAPGPPSLVNIRQGVARKEWDRTQKRRYRTLLAFFRETAGRGCQLFRVDLTTAPGGNCDAILRHFHELQRRIERVFGYEITYDQIRTREGHGVLHMVWAILADHAVWIPQAWLSAQWDDIHGAKIVHIQRVKGGRSSWGRISGYLVAHYLVNQQAIVSHTYSWWRCRLSLGKAFDYLRQELLYSKVNTAFWSVDIRDKTLTWRQLLDVWDEILLTGSSIVGTVRYYINLERRTIEKEFA